MILLIIVTCPATFAITNAYLDGQRPLLDASGDGKFDTALHEDQSATRGMPPVTAESPDGPQEDASSGEESKEANHG